MRRASRVCPHCGGQMYGDYTEAALVCFRCGRRERLPRGGGAHPKTIMNSGEAPDQRDRSRLDAPTRAVGLVEVGEDSRRLIESICTERGYRVVPVDRRREMMGRDQSCTADLLVVEADRAGVAVRLAGELRARFPGALVAVVVTYWCEAEKEARAAAEFVLHAPLRQAQVALMFQVMEDYGGWLPGRLLASKFSASLAG